MKRKIISLLIALAMALSVPACLAEGSGSSNADDFLANLGKTWDSFVGMVGDAGQSAADWANENGVTDWVNGAASSVSDWVQNSGVTDWVNGAVSDVTAWAYDSGVVDWAQGALDSFAAWAGDASLNEWVRNVSAQAQALIDENGPAVEAWLAQAGEDIAQAWNTLVNADDHPAEDVRQAYITVVDALEETVPDKP